MTTIIAFIIGCIVGGCYGVLIMACVLAGDDEDDK